jgi:2-amino-4-hydroxy-6-hydroxymethyldihydropteridine diphosphokinase
MHTAYIGMGANLPSHAGPPEATLAAAAVRLASLGRVVSRSSLYSTAPVGFTAQPRFINAVIALETELTPRPLLQALSAIEQEFGRDRSSGLANGPRTLDLDILLYGNLCISEPDLEIPHPRLAQRAFVLVPLNEIAPHVLDPRTTTAVSQLVERLFPGPHDESHTVVKVQSNIWCSGASRNVDRPATSAHDRTTDSTHHHHG